MSFRKFSNAWIQFLLMFAFCLYGAQSSNCGGVLEATVGELEHLPSDNSQRCLWVIKLPVPSSVIHFRLTKIPVSSQLSLYPQEGHVAGQITVLPIALTNTNESVSLTTGSSNMVVVWAPTDGFDCQVTSTLSFVWEGIEDQNQGQGEDSSLVGGVNFVEGQQGKFLWARAGAAQQTLLWLLNEDDGETSVTLTTNTDFERCDLFDPCQCSYLGIYQVYDFFLREVNTECAKTSSGTFADLERPLLALGFVNPKYQSGSSFVSLSWSSEQKNETTTQKTSTTTTTTTTTEEPTTCSSGKPKSCAEIQSAESGFNSSRNCVIYPFGPEGEPIEVWCDFETDGGHWTIIQKRSSGPKDEFYRGWAEYEQGFGSVDENQWIGLKTIYALTKNRDQELRVDLWDFEGDGAYAKYSNYSVSDSSDFYRLTVGGFSGTAGDSLNPYNGMRFTTKDKDNDEYSSVNCAVRDRGAWWYWSCSNSNLNGLYYEKGETPDPARSGMYWYNWQLSYRSLRKVEMKIRPRS